MKRIAIELGMVVMLVMIVVKINLKNEHDKIIRCYELYDDYIEVGYKHHAAMILARVESGLQVEDSTYTAIKED